MLEGGLETSPGTWASFVEISGRMGPPWSYSWCCRQFPLPRQDTRTTLFPLRGRTLVARFGLSPMVAGRGQMGVEGCDAGGEEGANQKARDLT